MHMAWTDHLTRTTALACLGLFAAPTAQALDVKTGIAVIQDPQTTIETLNYVYVGKALTPNLSFGQAVYSAATGDGGGAFFWGYEAAYERALSDRLSFVGTAFLGGGGGASVVYGDGLMTRLGAGLSYALTDAFRAELGVSHLTVKDSDVGGTVISAGIAYSFGAPTSDAPARPVLRAVTPRATLISADDSTTRSGSAQPTLALAGAEVAFFSAGSGREIFVAADGAAKGGEGYMQLSAGLRQRWSLGPLDLFADAALGFGGGGDVDTGGGLLVMAGLGGTVSIDDRHAIELALGQTIAPDGAFSGRYASARITRTFGDGPDTNRHPQAWQFQSGFTYQIPNDTFRKAGSGRTAAPILQESSVDMMLTDALYVTGNAQTVVSGDAGGYAIGLVGLGYQMALSPAWSIAVEGHIGAAGGGSVNANGGLIGSARFELDYALTDSVSLSLGVGQIRTLSGTGMAPTFVNLGVKIPFQTR